MGTSGSSLDHVTPPCCESQAGHTLGVWPRQGVHALVFDSSPLSLLSHATSSPGPRLTVMAISGLHFLIPSMVTFSTEPDLYAAQPVPSVKDWQELWVAWDTVTRAMIPEEDLKEKPIKLRNVLLFYLGHLPCFSDVHMARAASADLTHPAYYKDIFERGIDPDVENPERCHDHSKVPETWPPLSEILDYQTQVRHRIRHHTQHLRRTRTMGRALWLAFEHEAMHLETFLYMLLQSHHVLPPPGRGRPDFKAMALVAAKAREYNTWHPIPARELVHGLDDPEDHVGQDRFFGWDVEKPIRGASVHNFEAQARPVSNGEYAKYLEDCQSQSYPASWVTEVVTDGNISIDQEHGSFRPSCQRHAMSGTQPHHGAEKLFHGVASKRFVDGKSVRTVYGMVPLQYALDWPVMASYDELAAFAKWSNGRIPTLEEAQSVYSYVESLKEDVEKVPSSLISAVNGFVILV